MLFLQGCHQVAENWGLSDHRPIMLIVGTVNYGPRPFRFYNSWLLNSEFKSLVQEWWSSTTFQGWSGYILQQKLKALKVKIKSWSGYSRRGMGEAIKGLETELQAIMGQLEEEGPVNELRLKRVKVMDDLWIQYRKEESFWRQKSRTRWLLEGDKNTAFFHSICRRRKARKGIRSLVVEGATIEDPNLIKLAILNHYKRFFTRADKQRPKLRCNNLQKLSRGEAAVLESPFTEEEIWEVLRSCDGNRAPGPDGFNLNFFKTFWPAIKEEVIRFFLEFHSSGKLVQGLNAAFITLIPKQLVPESITDYRPISLIGCAYKLISKVLAARIKSVMPKLISHNQFAFTQGRQISDCILIANEVVDLLNKRQGGGFLLKLDFAKAYDNVEWSFLLDIMKVMNFGDRWNLWMRNCISTASLAILVNGSPTEFFNIEKGLRQGDPLSPFLFNLVANGLSCMLNQLLEDSLFSGVKLGVSLRLNHLQFADDTLLFCENDEEQLDLLCNALLSFLFASGLKINLSKTTVFGCNIPNNVVERIASYYGWGAGILPVQYLGAPLGGNPRRKSFWEPMLDKLRAKSRSWNSKYTSLSGRLVLAKSALLSLPIYLMSIFKAPVGVVGEIEKIVRAFVWGNCDGNRKIIWISWVAICQSKELGGLGLGFIGWRNKALLLKWAWRFGVERSSLWRKTLVSKYNLDDRLLLLHEVLPSRVSWSPLMQDILSILREQTLLAKGLREGIRCKVGDGRMTRFWSDPWEDIVPLRVKFPRVFSICSNKTEVIADVGCIIQGKWKWDLSFRRSFFDWESPIYSDFLSAIDDLYPTLGKADSLIWTHDNSGTFSIKSLYKWAEAKAFPDCHWVIPSKTRKALPPKVGLLFWQACKNKVATMVNLISRGVVLPDSGLCVLCGTEPETSSHLFMHCSVSWGLWAAIMNREGLCWVIPGSLESLAAEWDSLAAISDAVLWNLSPYALVWTLWLCRNEKQFNNKPFSAPAAWDAHLVKISWWTKNVWKDCPYDSSHFLANFTNISVCKAIKPPRVAVWTPPRRAF